MGKLKSRTYEAARKAVTIWMDPEILARLDEHLEALATANPEARYSRQNWILAQIKDRLDSRQGRG